MLTVQTHILYESMRKIHPFIHEFKTLIDWESLAEAIDFRKHKSNNFGRPPYPIKTMLKIIILQDLFNLSDEQTERQINCNIAYKYFLDMELDEWSPDENTIAYFREQLREHGMDKVLFKKFHEILKENNVSLSKGTIIDSSFIRVPVSRNTSEENKQIQNGEEPASFAENEHKKRQKDTDARWTKKRKQTVFGYKNHIACTTGKQFITSYETTPANTHDSQVVEGIVPEDATEVYGDSAYSGQPIATFLKERGCRNCIHEKGYKNKPLSEGQKARNKQKSKTRAKVEHVFAWFRTRMNRGLELRCIGLARVRFRIGIRNTIYNMLRFVSIQN